VGATAVQSFATASSVLVDNAASFSEALTSVGATNAPPAQWPTHTSARSPPVPRPICDARHLFTILWAPVAYLTPDLLSVLTHLSRASPVLTCPGVPAMSPTTMSAVALC